MKYLLALDQSTTHARALVVDYLGQQVSVAEKEITQIYPHPGWVEHDPNEIWSAQIAVATQALRQANIGPANIAVKDNGGVYFVPAFVGLGAPYWDPSGWSKVLNGTRPDIHANLP
jgi:glycerol kinase